jgi:hypothetical protein
MMINMATDVRMTALVAAVMLIIFWSALIPSIQLDKISLIYENTLSRFNIFRSNKFDYFSEMIIEMIINL